MHPSSTQHNPMISRRGFLARTAAMGGAALFARQTFALEDAPTSEGADLPLVDCHLHINHFQRSTEETIKHMDATGTDRAFFLPRETGGVNVSTETVLDAHQQYPDRVIPFCQCDLLKPDALERIRAYQKLGCLGVGEQKDPLPLGDPRVEAVIALCDEFDWPITVHFQDGKNGFNQGIAEHLERYLKTYKRVRIQGHAQTWWANISAEVPPPEKTLYPKGPVKPGGLIDRLLSEYPNLYADMSAGSGYGALTRDEAFTAGFLERHRKQLLFGSDCPCRDGAGENFKGVCYNTRLQSFLKRMVTDKDALRDIFHDNALRALRGTA